MTDEVTDEERTDAGRPDAPVEDPAGGGPRRERRHPRWPPVVAGGVAVLVVVAAAFGYHRVIPITHVDRTRLARLVITRPGVKEFNTKPAQSVELPVAKTGLSVLQNAAKKAPDSSGSYLVAWTGTGPNDAMESVAFLAPSTAVAKKLAAQVLAMNLAAKALASSSLTRLSTFTVGGVPGSHGSLYGGSAKTPGPSQLAITTFEEGRVVTVTEALQPTSAQPDSETATTAEYRHLQAAAPGFSLKVVHRPLTATILWAAAAVAIAALIALSPVIVGRVRRRRRERREAEERARGSLVPGHKITKRQR